MQDLGAGVVHLRGLGLRRHGGRRDDAGRDGGRDHGLQERLQLLHLGGCARRDHHQPEQQLPRAGVADELRLGQKLVDGRVARGAVDLQAHGALPTPAVVVEAPDLLLDAADLADLRALDVRRAVVELGARRVGGDAELLRFSFIGFFTEMFFPKYFLFNFFLIL